MPPTIFMLGLCLMAYWLGGWDASDMVKSGAKMGHDLPSSVLVLSHLGTIVGSLGIICGAILEHLRTIVGRS
jgi:hypothetical protein